MEKVQLNSINKKQNGLEQSKNYMSFTLPRVGRKQEISRTTDMNIQ